MSIPSHADMHVDWQ